MALPIRSAESTAIVPYNPSSLPTARKTHLEFLSSKIVKRSLESVRCEARHFSQVASNFTGRNFVRITSKSLLPKSGLGTDSRIDIEIMNAASCGSKSPILIFSHGYGSQPVNHRAFLGELASHGYTVINLTHLSSAEEIPGLTPEQETGVMDSLAVVMAQNIQYVISEIRNGALANLGDSNKIALGGHSLGGAASIIVSRADPAIAACINLDGFLKGDAKTEKVAQPLLMLIGDYQKEIEELEQAPEEKAREYAKLMSRSLGEYETLCSHSPHAEKVVIPGAAHKDFSDQPLRDHLAGRGVLSAAIRVHAIASREVLKFLEVNLARK